jgi:hypothetical protein
MTMKRIWCTVAATVMSCALQPADAALIAWHETSRSNLITIFRPSPTPVLRDGNGGPWVAASLAFTVSVCLADVEFSIACWERGLAEAARRLEQIYLDVYATRRAAGSLKVWFTVATAPSEQLRFLREAEERAIKTVAAKLRSEGDQRISPITSPPQEQGEPEGPAGERNRQLQKWRENAGLEARRGTNWSHDWSSRTHAYQLGAALYELAHLRQSGT